MNKTFDWSRFGKLVRKDFSNIWQNAGTSLLIITLLPLAVWLFWWALSGVTPSRMYRTCNLQKEGIYYAMLPASKLEKYLSMLLFTVVICPLLCLCGSIVLDYFLTLLPFGSYNKWLWQTDYLAEGLDYYRLMVSGNVPNMDSEKVRVFTEVVTPGKVVLYGLVAYLNYVALFLFTNTIFVHQHNLQEA